MRPVHLLQLALSLAQKLEDACASAACVLHLAMFFFYWIPHYEVASQLLQRLDDECTSLLLHLPLCIGPSYERSGIATCPSIARDVLRQFKQHRMAGLRTPFFVGTTISLPFPEGTVDCIICADVLEHTADPWAVVAKLKELLKPDGCIVASIPNVGFHRNIRKMLRGQWTYAQEGLLDKTHLRFFTLETITELFASNGLKIERVFKKVDAGWNVRILNALTFGYLRNTLYLHYIVRVRR
jgi:SAM-dependent methyltransferase